MNNDENLIHQEMQPEEPVFIIERDDEKTPPAGGPTPMSNGKNWRKWLWMAVALMAIMALAFGAYKGWRLYNARKMGVSISVKPEDNIEKLEKTPQEITPEVIHTNDSILGVELDFYELQGLRANIEFKEPKLTDTSVYLYCRSADHTEDSIYLGTLVVDGVEKPSEQSRLGYMAMTDSQMVIGVSPSEAVKDYVMNKGGSFFRQFVLVSNHGLPPRFYLNGKNIRKAIGRIKDSKGDKLFMVSTRNKVTVNDFARALQEYGFIDAIYITGGPDYCYYRSNDKQRHDIGDIKNYPNKKWEGFIPWLVFRKI